MREIPAATASCEKEARSERRRTHAHKHARMPRPTRGIPIQTVPRVLTERTEETVEHLHNGNENVELEHGLASDPMVQLADGDGAEDLAVDEPDEDTLH